MAIILVDIDGTIANIPDDYFAFIKVKPKHWQAFEFHIKHDDKIEPVLYLLDLFAKNNDTIILLTARPERNREDTIKWLKLNKVPFDFMYMRSDNDFRPDNIVKEELLDLIEKEFGKAFMVFEDRKHNCDMFVRNGIFVFNVAQTENA